ncbi:MAG: LVIVD repeat-containing protein, partial [Solirubrobacteraceae bacterium]
MQTARWSTSSVVVLALLVLAAPAAAHETGFGSAWWMGGAHHPGWYTPSPESQTSNVNIVGSVSRTRADSTYRNSDLAFWGRYAYAGHYDGFQIVDISNPRKPEQMVDHPCPGSQHDVSVWRNLLFVSVETPRQSPECGSATAGPPSNTPGFEGIRIFDVSNPRAPELIAGVPTDCGSHTHTLVPDLENGRVLLYVASYTATEIQRSSYGNECLRFDSSGQPAHNKISVVGVPLRNPASASVVSEPRHPQNDFRSTPGFQGCHDITVNMELERAAAACMGEGQIWDISDKANPETIARVHNPNVEFFHSATFSSDGKTVVYGDEAGGGTQPRCRAQDPDTLGALWFYDVGSLDTMDGSTPEQELSHWKVPRIQGDLPNCTMHNFNTLPTTKRNVLVSSAYAAGTTVVDFTDPRKPTELGHHDPHGANTWSSYWYNGHIYTNDGGRGVDVMKVSGKVDRGASKLPYS